MFLNEGQVFTFSSQFFLFISQNILFGRLFFKAFCNFFFFIYNNNLGCIITNEHKDKVL